jgi:hypothetical protein
MFSKRQKQNLERKLVVHFPRRTLINEKRKSNHKESTITTQSILSTKVKTQSKPMSSSMQMKNVLSNQQENEKHQALNSQPITGAQPI